MEGVIGCILWTIFLSPYMLLVTKMTALQFISWIIMEVVLIMPLAPVVFRTTKYIMKKLRDDNDKIYDKLNEIEKDIQKDKLDEVKKYIQKYKK